MLSEMLVSGAPITEISRRTGRDRESIAKVLQATPDVQHRRKVALAEASIAKQFFRNYVNMLATAYRRIQAEDNKRVRDYAWRVDNPDRWRASCQKAHKKRAVKDLSGHLREMRLELYDLRSELRRESA